MIIRQVKQSDNLHLSKMIKNVFEEYNAPKIGTVYSDPTTNNLYELFKENKSALWVAEQDGEIKGCCGIYPTKGLPNGCVEIVKFYISKDARGKGLGKILMEKSVESAKIFDYNELYIESLPEFSNAVRIYKKQGFIIIDKPLCETGHSGCDIWMVKKLN